MIYFNNVNDATFHDDFPAPLPACEYLDMPTIFDKDISNNGVAYYIATENLLSLLMSALTTAASEICSHHEILSLWIWTELISNPRTTTVIWQFSSNPVQYSNNIRQGPLKPNL